MMIKGPGLHVIVSLYRHLRLRAADSIPLEEFFAEFDKLSGELPQELSSIAGIRSRFTPDATAAEKANAAAELAGFIEGLTENIAYERYLDNGGTEIETKYRAAWKKLLSEIDAGVIHTPSGLDPVNQQPEELAASLPALLRLYPFEETRVMLDSFATSLTQQKDGAVPLRFIESLYNEYPHMKADSRYREFMAATIEHVLVVFNHINVNTNDLTTLALYYNALAIADKLRNDPKCREYFTTPGTDYRSLQPQIAKTVRSMITSRPVQSSDILLVSLSSIDDLLPNKDKQRIINSIAKEGLLLPYGLTEGNSTNSRLLFQYLAAERKLMAGAVTETVLAEINYRLNNILAYVERTGILPGTFDAKTYVPAGLNSDPAAVAALLKLIDALNVNDQRIYTIDTEKLPQISIEQLKRVLAAS